MEPLLRQMKAAWVQGNPYYERVEGIVAGTPSLAEYDVILDAGSSAAEDPQSAVPFDLTLSDGTVLKQPGNLYNLTEGALWGTLPKNARRPGAPADLDGDGTVEFGEVLPDPGLLLAASETFTEYAKELDTAGEAWRPTPSDAFTAIVVMVPTMSEYFGQWKVSRFVAGDAASAEAFNVVSRLSDIRDILTGLEVIYDGVEPAIGRDRRGAGRSDGAGARRPACLHRETPCARTGGEALHAGAGGHARQRGAGAGDGRRRANLTSGGAAGCRNRAVARRAVAAVATLAASSPRSSSRRRRRRRPSDAPWRLAADLRTHVAEAERALILGQPAAARAHVRQALPRANQLAELLREDEINAAFRGVEAAVAAR